MDSVQVESWALHLSKDKIGRGSMTSACLVQLEDTKTSLGRWSFALLSCFEIMSQLCVCVRYFHSHLHFTSRPQLCTSPQSETCHLLYQPPTLMGSWLSQSVDRCVEISTHSSAKSPCKSVLAKGTSQHMHGVPTHT